MKLSECCIKIGSGATPRGGKESYLESGPFSLIRSQNVHNNLFLRSGLAFISEEQARQLQNVEVKCDDVLLNITGDSVAREFVRCLKMCCQLVLISMLQSFGPIQINFLTNTFTTS